MLVHPREPPTGTHRRHLEFGGAHLPAPRGADGSSSPIDCMSAGLAHGGDAAVQGHADDFRPTQGEGGRGLRIWIVLANPPLATRRGQIGGWKRLDFLGFSRPNRAYSMGYRRFSAKVFFAPLAGRQSDSSRSIAPVCFPGHAVFRVRPQILSPRSERRRSPVAKPSILRPSWVFGKTMSIILGDGWTAPRDASLVRGHRRASLAPHGVGATRLARQ